MMNIFSELFNKKFIKYLLFIILACPYLLFSQSSVEHELNQYLVSYKSVKNIPSISGGAIKNGKIIWLKTIGLADVENFVPATDSTVYRIASISKLITASAIMQLVEKGKVKLDDDVRKYLNYFPKKKYTFTVRQLLNHTAGIRDYMPGEFDSKVYFHSTKEVINLLAKDSLIFEPGTAYQYTTLGYNLLAGVIEQVTGMSYLDYVTNNIFKPLKMNRTSADIQKDIIYYRARGYIRDNARELKNAPLADLSIKYPGGGFLSTASDLLKFANALLDGKIFSRNLLDTMAAPTKLKNGKSHTYGMGVDRQIDFYGRVYYTHSGSGTGFVSEIMIYPGQKIATVHLINLKDRQLESPAAEFASILLGSGYHPLKISLADRLLPEFFTLPTDSVFNLYSKIKSDSSEYYNINEEEFSFLGYDLLKNNLVVESVMLFKLYVREFPNYYKAYSGLADAYLRDGNKGLAAKNFRSAIKLNPQDKYSINKLKKLSSQK
ncbi:MAG: serine hydrolase [Ignavibacteriales bacterium]|nr:serine hydrolase [Ignavibacteriales bacterium]